MFVLSQDNFLSENLITSMTKLNQAYVVEILRRLNLGNRGTYSIGSRFGVSPRRVRQLEKEYKETGMVPKLKRPGPKAMQISEEVKRIITAEWKENPVGALALERILAMSGMSGLKLNTGEKIPPLFEQMEILRYLRSMT